MNPKEITRQSNAATYRDYSQSQYPQCKVVYYNWTFASDSVRDVERQSVRDLALSERLDISAYVMSANFRKNNSKPAGEFEITLSNTPSSKSPLTQSRDWKNIIRRGSWLVIYMANDGSLTLSPTFEPTDLQHSKQIAAKEKPYIRCIGFVERVAVVQKTNETTGAVETSFSVTGRDFGIVYEEGVAWHDFFQFEKAQLQAIKQSFLTLFGYVPCHEVVPYLHHLFYYPLNIPELSGAVNDRQSLLKIGLQWLLPTELIQDLGIQAPKSSYWGSLPNILRIEKSSAGLGVSEPIDYLSGNIWQNLKELSVPEFHELYCETDETGSPALWFRPIPFLMSNTSARDLQYKPKLYVELPDAVVLDNYDIIDLNLGEDESNRFNVFLTTVSHQLVARENNISVLQGTEWPKYNQNSIARYGVKPMTVMVPTILKAVAGQDARLDGYPDPIKLKAFNQILYDYWAAAYQGESGTVQTTGRSEVKINKPLEFTKETDYVGEKRFYIEGYEDSFTVNNQGAANWNQRIFLTRGFDITELKRIAQLPNGFETLSQVNRQSNRYAEFTVKN